MVERIVDSITSEIYRREVVKEKDLPIIRYGLQAMIETFVIAGTMLIISIFFNQVLEAVAWIGTVIIIRSLGGGSHARTFQQCYLITVGLFVLSMLLVNVVLFKQLIQISLWIGYIVAVLFFIYLFILFPRKEGRNALFKISLATSLTYNLIMFLLLFLQLNSSIMMASLMGLILSQLSNYLRRKESIQSIC